MPRQARRLMRQGVADLPTRGHVDAYIGPNGEVISDGETLRLQNGATPGGIPMARKDDTRLWAVPQRTPNWTEFGPGGAGQGNAVADTAAFQAAIATGGRLTLKSASPILLNDGAVATKYIHMEGENLAAPIKLTAAFPQAGDVLTLKPTPTFDGSKFFGWRVAGLKIDPQANGRGRHGIVIDLSVGQGAQMTGLAVECNQIGDVIAQADGFVAMGGAAVVFIPHPTQADQLYCSTITKNYLVGGPGVAGSPGGGIYGRRVGDSVHLDENWIKGYGRAIDVEYVAGAANSTIHRNNLTASGGSIRARYGLRLSILDNQIELLTAWTGDADQDLIVIEDSDGTVIDLNNINGDLSDHSALRTAGGISLKGTTIRTDIRAGNRIAVNGAAGRRHLHTTAGVTATTFHEGMRIENPFLTVSTRTASVLTTDIATPGSVRGLWLPITLLAGWGPQATGGSTFEGLFAKIQADGRVALRGNLAPGTLAAGTVIASGLPADMRGAKTMRLYPKQGQANGSNNAIGFLMRSDGALVLAAALPEALPISFDDVSYNPTAQ